MAIVHIIIISAIAGIILKSELQNFFSVKFSYAIQVPTDKFRYFVRQWV